jgi:hypothetical protein
MAKKVKRGEYPAETYIPTSHFNVKSDPFDTLIEKFGYKVKIFKSTVCPCQLSDKNEPQINCGNCGGTGYIFYNPVETRAIITSLNYRTKVHEWTVENIGTISITTYSNLELTIMDKVQILETYSVMTQLINVVHAPNGTLFSYLKYKPTEVSEVFAFASTTEPLEVIPESAYSITEFGLKWNTDFYLNRRISIRYTHLFEYLIIDIPHNMRQSTYKEFSGEITQDDFPVNGVGRLAHFAMDIPDYDGSKLFNNNTL